MLSMLILKNGDCEFQDKSCLKYISFFFNLQTEHKNIDFDLYLIYIEN